MCIMPRLCVYVNTSIYECVSMQIYTCMHTCKCIDVHNRDTETHMYTHIYVYVCVYTHTHRSEESKKRQNKQKCQPESILVFKTWTG